MVYYFCFGIVSKWDLDYYKVFLEYLCILSDEGCLRYMMLDMILKYVIWEDGGKEKVVGDWGGRKLWILL